MKRFNNILVAFTGSPADRRALEWARLVARAAGSERVEVLLLEPEPADWVPEFSLAAGLEPWDDRIREIENELAAEFEEFAGLSLQTRSGVGSPLPTILQKLVDSSCDLVILGVDGLEDRRLAEKLARKSPATVLSVPLACSATCGSILTAVDFSDSSALTLDIAMAFGAAFESARLACLHTFRLPSNLHTEIVSSASLKDAYLESVSSHLANFLSKHGAPSHSIEPVVREAAVPSAGILEELSHQSYDLVVMATRGRSSVGRALLGSNTADVIRHSAVPVLSVKAKGEGLAILRTLLGGSEKSSPDPASA